MPTKKRTKPLYKRGRYALYRREGRTNLEIVWYDEERMRERSASARTGDVREAKLALDRLYLGDDAHRFCPTCHRAWDHEGSPELVTVITDYLIQSEGKVGIKSSKTRLGHVLDYLVETDAATTCAQIDLAWVNKFRAWMLKRPIVSPNGNVLGKQSIGHVEGCVRQLAAAINATPGQSAQFKAEQPKNVSRSPVYRADVKTLAAMFKFAMAEPYRINLLRYLQMAVATWARPDAIFDVRRDQWHSEPRVLDMNPVGRRQTKKHRPKVPVARQFAPLLDDFTGNWIPVTTIRTTWDKMRKELGLPGGREAGPKLVRRSMATIGRKRIGETHWVQGRMMLGHVKTSVSDIYAIPDPANIGLALEVTESIIDEIEAMAPGAFRRLGANLKIISSV